MDGGQPTPWKPPDTPKPEPPKPVEIRRLPVPDADAQAAALKEIRELFKEKYAGTRKPDQKRALARLLLQQAVETRDNPAARFMLYSEARDMAAAAGDANLLVAVVTAMGREYKLEWQVMAADTLVKAARKPRDAVGNQSLARLALEMGRTAIRKDEYDLAEVLAMAARDMAREGRDFATVKQAVAMLNDIEERKQLHETFAAAEKTLAQKPDDPEANRVSAAYYCLVKHDWPRGLPLLLKGDDETLKGLAQAESAAAPGSAPDQVALGDRWYEAVSADEQSASQLARARAVFWYQRALPGLTGLTRSKVEKRLAELSE